MTYKEKVDFLKSYQAAVHRMKGLSLEYEKYKHIGGAISQQISAAPAHGSGTGDKTGKAGMGMADIRNQIEQETREAFEIRKNVKAAIDNKCKRKRYAEILTLKYINGMSDSGIADEYKKDVRTIKNVLRTAIESLDI